MGTTANRGYVYPDSTSNVQIWTHMKDLADSIDADVQALATAATNRKTLVDQRTTDSAGITSTTVTSVLSVTLPATGTYEFSVLAVLTNTVATGQPGFALGGTSTATAWRWASEAVHYNTASGSQGGGTSGTTYVTTGTAIVNTSWTTTGGFSAVTIKGTVTVSAAGTLTFGFSEASGSGTVTIKAGSIATVRMTN